MGTAKVSTLLVKRVTGANAFFPGTVVSLCVPSTHRYLPLCSLRYTLKLCNKTLSDQPPYTIYARGVRMVTSRSHDRRVLAWESTRVKLVSRCSTSPRGCLVSHPTSISNNATSRAREAACRVEPVPTHRRVTPGLERMGQQHIQHYQHPTDHYRHRHDTHTAHILLVQVRFQALRFWVYARFVQYA